MRIVQRTRILRPLLCLLAAPAIAGGTETKAAAPYAPPEGSRYVTSAEGIHEYRLDNGLRVLLFPDPAVQTTTVNVTYFCGSLHEGYGETGMAHLLEHLLFKGTPDHPDIPNELTSHGCRPNGSTWLDRTNYFETFAATEENLDWALDLEADRMVNSFISAEDLESEMTVVRNEFESGENDPLRVLEERIYSTAYLWHNYGNTTIGARSDIENVPIERLQAFYRTWYRPDNAMLVVSGRFDPERTLGKIVEEFGAIDPPETPQPTVYTAEPAQDGERTVTLRRVGDSQAVGVGYHIPAGPHPEHAALAVLAHVLGDTPSGRLHRALVETGKAASVRAHADRFREAGLLTILAEVREGRPLDEVEAEILEIAENAGAVAPTEAEVERARAGLLRRWESRMRNSSWSAIGLSEWGAMGDWRLLFLHRDRLKEVTPEEVRAAAAKYLIPSNRTVGRFLPTEEPLRAAIPETPDLEEMIDDDIGGKGLARGEEFDPSPANIEDRVERTSLSCGTGLVLLPKKTRGETVHLSVRLHFGTEESLRGLAVAGDLAGSMLMRGTETRTRQQIQDEIDRLQASLRIYGGATAVMAGLEVARPNLEESVRLLAELLRNPSFPESEFDQLIEERVHRIEESRSDPRSKAFTRIQQHLYPYPAGHVRAVLTPDEELESLRRTTVEDAARFHREHYGASDAQIAVVGDFDPQEIRGLLAALIGDWESPQAYERVGVTYEERPPILESIETPDKESAVFNAGIRIEMSEEDPEYPAMLLANLMTGGGFLNSRLATRIRGEEGLSYGVRSMFWANAWDRDARFGAFAIYAPQNDARLLAAFREEMEKILSAGFTAEEVEQAKSGWLQRQTVSRSQDRDLSRTLAARAHEDRTLEWDRKLEERVAALTPDEIHAVVRKHLDLDRFSIVRAGDFANASEATEEAAAERPRRGRPEGGAR